MTYKKILQPILVLLFSCGTLVAQEKQPAEDWHMLDPNAGNHVQGMSVDKAYEILKGRKSETVTVAVIDSGIDIDHEDLEGKIWINEDEIPGNGKDDDKNGYVDDRYGWNFIGGPEANIEADSYELTRIYVELKKKYGDVTAEEVNKKNKKEYDFWLEIKDKFEADAAEAQQEYQFYQFLQGNLLRFNNLLKAYVGVDTLEMNHLYQINSPDSLIIIARNIIGSIYQNMGEDVDFATVEEELQSAVDHYDKLVNYAYNPDFDPRGVVGDNYKDPYEKGYGNPDVEGPDASHGTHVAGIIAANRNNALGMKGIADNVKIMAIRAVPPEGDERDKDIANAIIYAVDNGAQIINMSFGKSYSPYKEAVDKAVKYAADKGVLMILGAGNSSKNIDKSENFPSEVLLSGETIEVWMDIGATGFYKDENLVGDFSNYGKETVDVFAPGVEIYSTIPDNSYENFSGTSMAAPATTGVAALLMSYFPDLNAKQVKEIIMQSAIKYEGLEVTRPGKSGLPTPFSELSVSGGIVNAYEAVKMALEMSRN
ncbi:MAG: S8 family peptidase [Fulvivirga sp.]|nr:S8 family peptidase [Fulvivirga sp.]